MRKLTEAEKRMFMVVTGSVSGLVQLHPEINQIAGLGFANAANNCEYDEESITLMTGIHDLILENRDRVVAARREAMQHSAGLTR